MKVNPQKRVKANLFENSYFWRMISRFTKWIYLHIINGFLGKIFTSYSVVEEKFQKSATAKRFWKNRTSDKKKSKLRLDVAKYFEESLFVTSLKSFFSSLVKIRMKEYGTLFAVTGALGLLIYMLEGGSFYVFFRDVSSLVTSSAFVLLGLVMLISKKNLSETVSESRFLSELLFNGLGISKDLLKVGEAKSRGYLIPILFGLFFGGLSYLVNPLYYVVALLCVIFAVLVISFPEIGVLALFAAIPVVGFLSHPSLLLLAIVGITTLSYLIKLVRGKRIIRLKLVDFAVLGFLFVRLASGIFSAGGLKSFAEALLSCGLMLAYFLTVNLINGKEWIKRAVFAFLMFAAVSAIVGVTQFFGGGFESGWLDSSAFSGIAVRITSTFENPNIYGVYLLLVIPFFVSSLTMSASGKRTLLLGASLLMMLFCVVQTWSRGAWLGLIVGTVVFLLIFSRKTLPFIVLGGGAVSLGVSVFAPNVYNRFLSISNLAESSISYRLSAWKGILDMLSGNWLCGIGFGESAFCAVYPAFAYSGAQAVKHAHSLYLQIVTESGIVGAVSFGAAIFLLAQSSLEYLRSVKTTEERATVIAGLAAVSGALVMGLTDYIWYSHRAFLCFWLVVALTNASVRVGVAECDRINDSLKNSLYSAALELNSDAL